MISLSQNWSSNFSVLHPKLLVIENFTILLFLAVLRLLTLSWLKLII